MKVTRHQLRRIIRESLMREMYMAGTSGTTYGRPNPPKKDKPRGPTHGVNISDIHRAKSKIKDWADLLLDDIEDDIPQISNIPDEKRDKVLDDLTRGTISSLGTALGNWAPRRKG